MNSIFHAFLANISVDVLSDYEKAPSTYEAFLRRHVKRIRTDEPYPWEVKREDLICDSNLNPKDITSPLILAMFMSRSKGNIDLSTYSEDFQRKYVHALAEVHVDFMDALARNVEPHILAEEMANMPKSRRWDIIISNIVINKYERYYSIIPDLVRAHYRMDNLDVINVLPHMNEETKQDLFNAIREYDPRLAWVLDL